MRFLISKIDGHSTNVQRETMQTAKKPRISLKLDAQQAADMRAAMKFALVGKNGPDFIAKFYDELFKQAPQMRSHFPEDLTGLKKKLLSTIGEVFSRLEDTAAIEKMLLSIKPKHSAIPSPGEVADVFVTCFGEAYFQVVGTRFPRAQWYLLAALLTESVLVLITVDPK